MQKYLPFILYYGSALLLLTHKLHCLQTFEHMSALLAGVCEVSYTYTNILTARICPGSARSSCHTLARIRPGSVRSSCHTLARIRPGYILAGLCTLGHWTLPRYKISDLHLLQFLRYWDSN